MDNVVCFRGKYVYCLLNTFHWPFLLQVRIAKSLIKAGIETNDIAILAPYNAQVAKINEILAEKKENITVSSIMKSQGNLFYFILF